MIDWFSDDDDEQQPAPGVGETLVPDLGDDASAEVPDAVAQSPAEPEPPAKTKPGKSSKPAPGTGTMLPPDAGALAGADGDASDESFDSGEAAIDDGTLDPITHGHVPDRFDDSVEKTPSGSRQKKTSEPHGTMLPDPAAPAESADEKQFVGGDTAKTFVPSATDDVDAVDEFADDDFAEMDTVVPGRPEASDAASAGTVMDDGAIDNETTIFNESMGNRIDEDMLDDDDDGDEAVAEHSSLKSLMGKSSRHGLDRSLRIRNRPVKGDEPFSQAPDADYEIIEKLAEGGMGIVYIARQTSLARQLAIKTLKPLTEAEKKQMAKSGRMSQMTRQRREMFLSEALVTANLVHPNIVPIHDLCQTDAGIPFYSMKQVEGKPWNKHITEMTEEENLEVLLKVADAVAYAHHNGVINRDLKPENIMLGEFGEVVVLDWGLAIPAPDSGQTKFATTSTSFGAGTPAYMSPELWAGPPEKIGKHSDIYLLGAILFEIVTGLPPHEFPAPPSGASKTTIIKIIDAVVRPNEIRDTNIESELLDIARRAMESEPEDRYQSVQEFQVAVRAYQQHEESRHLGDRADELVRKAETAKSKEYSDYQTATALYREALVGWDDNFYARKGLHEAQLKYSQLAYDRGDYDLGLQLVQDQAGKDFESLSAKLTKAKRRRGVLKNGRRSLLGFIRSPVRLRPWCSGNRRRNIELVGSVRRRGKIESAGEAQGAG
ncbi:MAG: protein kinase [Planctomycetaceae bacterium]